VNPTVGRPSGGGGALQRKVRSGGSGASRHGGSATSTARAVGKQQVGWEGAPAPEGSHVTRHNVRTAGVTDRCEIQLAVCAGTGPFERAIGSAAGQDWPSECGQVFELLTCHS
jgi:hypothetical protein